MIIYETNGDFVTAYSDQGVYIHGGSPEGNYATATDPASAGRVYTETDIPIETDDRPEVEQKADAYDVIMGEKE